MTKISFSNDAAKAEAVAQQVVYRNIDRTTLLLENVGTSYSSFQIEVPFSQGLLKRIIIYKANSGDPATTADIIVSESSTASNLNKVAQYNSIDFTVDYLDSLEDIYYETQTGYLYIHAKVDSGSENNLQARLDLEKVN